MSVSHCSGLRIRPGPSGAQTLCLSHHRSISPPCTPAPQLALRLPSPASRAAPLQYDCCLLSLHLCSGMVCTAMGSGWSPGSATAPVPARCLSFPPCKRADAALLHKVNLSRPESLPGRGLEKGQGSTAASVRRTCRLPARPWGSSPSRSYPASSTVTPQLCPPPAALAWH